MTKDQQPPGDAGAMDRIVAAIEAGVAEPNFEWVAKRITDVIADAIRTGALAASDATRVLTGALRRARDDAQDEARHWTERAERIDTLLERLDA